MQQRHLRYFLLCIVALAPALGGADGGCSPEVSIGEDVNAAARGEGVPCGDVSCTEGEVCCNPSCGVCTPPGGACTTEICEDISCTETMNAIRTLLRVHAGCAVDEDCTLESISCLPGPNCTGGVYVNREIDRRELSELTAALNTCVTGSSDLGCAVCDRADAPPACVEGLCQAQTSGRQPPQDPCAGKACGETCSTCIDGQPCRAILESCDADGVCGGPAPCDEVRDPCAGKTCGDECSTCVPGEPCLAILEYCSTDGVCGSAAPRCR